MAGRRSPVSEIREILRRLQLGERARRIARDLGVSRNTVAHYRRWAAKHGLLLGPLPEPAALAALLAAPPGERPAQEQSLVEPFCEQVLAWHAQGVEGQAIWQLLVERHGFGGSYSSIKRSCAVWHRRRPGRRCGSKWTPGRRPRWTSASAACIGIPTRTGCGAPGCSS